MSTEGIDPRFVDLDKWSTMDAVSAMAEGQFWAIAAVAAAAPQIAAAVDASAERVRTGQGRLVYAGAGTSGRVAVQDGVELLPTFGWPWKRLAFAVAGGQAALMQAVENAEDDKAAGHAFIADNQVGPEDVVIGVAASGRTPYTIGVIEAARASGALTVAMANNADTPLLAAADHGILLDTGPEAVAGSTRMKAGTAQKVALNLYSTVLMVRLGGVYKGLMVGMQATNAKLRVRAVRIVTSLANCDETTAIQALKTAKGDLRNAVLVAMGFDEADERERLLIRSGGSLRGALEQLLDN